jgi:hypothetical protein
VYASSDREIESVLAATAERSTTPEPAADWSKGAHMVLQVNHPRKGLLREITQVMGWRSVPTGAGIATAITTRRASGRQHVALAGISTDPVVRQDARPPGPIACTSRATDPAAAPTSSWRPTRSTPGPSARRSPRGDAFAYLDEEGDGSSGRPGGRQHRRSPGRRRRDDRPDNPDRPAPGLTSMSPRLTQTSASERPTEQRRLLMAQKATAFVTPVVW